MRPHPDEYENLLLSMCNYPHLLALVKYLPSWFLFQQEAARGRQMIESLVTRPFEDVKE